MLSYINNDKLDKFKAIEDFLVFYSFYLFNGVANTIRQVDADGINHWETISQAWKANR